MTNAERKQMILEMAIGIAFLLYKKGLLEEKEEK